MTTSHRSSGQVAVGLAFTFMAFLAFFALVFQSSLLTREKMKLQQTNDLATLVGAQVQREALNEIIKSNEAIEAAYNKASLALKAPLCATLFAFGAGNPTAMSSIAAATTFGVKLSLQDISADTCQQACNQWDTFFRARIIDLYLATRNAHAKRITDILSKANTVAGAQAKKVFFAPENLPLRLRLKFQKHFGNAQSVVSQESPSAFSEHLEVVSTADLNNGQMPLFASFEQTRMLVFSKSQSKQTSVSPPACSFPVGIPSAMSVKEKIVRDPRQSFVSHFLSFALYDAPTSPVEGKFNLFLKQVSGEKFGQPIEEGSRPLSLLAAYEDTSSLDSRRIPMMALSLASVFGGAFPTKNRSSLSAGEKGKKFEGVKLIGLADFEQLENQEPLFEKLNVMGQSLSWQEFLH